MSWLTLTRWVWQAMLTRLQALLGNTSGTTLALTGVLGLAAVVYALYHLRGGAGRKPDEGEGSQQQPGQPRGAAGASTSAAAAAAARQPAAAPTPGAAVARRLAGVKRVTLSVPGVLLEERQPQELNEAATVLPQAVALARQLASCCTAGLYLMCHVDDDLGEAVVRGALEHAGLLGAARDQVPAHRLLFCSLLDSKCSFVRQLEPELHIDGHPQTVSDLQRFVKQLVLVEKAPQAAAGGSAPAANVQHAASLAAAMGLPVA